MSRNRACLLLLVLLSGLSCTSTGITSLGALRSTAASDRGLELDTWHVVETADFKLLTNLSAGEARRTAHRLARFADTVRVLMPKALPHSDTRAVIIGLKTWRQYIEFGPGGTSGYHLRTLEGPAMVLSMERRERAIPILYHEFAHHLMESEHGHDYPIWYHEGFAEMMSTVTVREDVATLGFVPGTRLTAIQSEDHVSPEVLLSLRDRSEMEDANQFYADAWLLVHYLHFQESEIGRKLSRYLRALTRGENPVAAFEAHFETPMERLGPELEAHRVRVRKRFASVIEIDVPEQERAFEAQPIAATELTKILAAQLVTRERFRTAGELLRFAREGAPDDPQLLMQLALVDAAEGDYELGERRAREVVASEGSAAAHAALGRVLAAHAESLEEDDDAIEQRAVAWQGARRAFEESVAQDPGHVRAWYGLARTYLGDDSDPERGILALEHADAALPWSVEIHLTFASLLSRQGELERAVEHASLASSLAANKEQAERARDLLDSIRESSAERSANEASTQDHSP